ncbi:hypothetical protein BDN70DRAFT_163244 [Pholiota conissans]|uniref:Uncharacterized protein n=1 Tax=Pholiota conissans TaxID=109636 RepID=A0A9P5ZBC1_9AGAR|nr:hypothetical protein BDN70DRAFT_163244 [Pholiota conissans]
MFSHCRTAMFLSGAACHGATLIPAEKTHENLGQVERLFERRFVFPIKRIFQFDSGTVCDNDGRIANARARILLQTMFKLFVPPIQYIHSQTSTNDPGKIPLGDEANDFVNELKNFISGVISRQGKQEICVEVVLQDKLDYLEGTQWLWDLSTETKTLADGSSNDKLAIAKQTAPLAFPDYNVFSRDTPNLDSDSWRCDWWPWFA